MKKILFAFVAALSVVACTKRGPEGPQGPQGEPGEGSTFAIVNFDVPQAAWQYTNTAENNYFYADVEMPEITEDVFDGCIINVYRTYNFNSKDASQQILPSVRMFEQHLSNGSTAYYTETIDYEYGIGWIRIFYTVSDFIYEDDLTFVPDAMTFRAVIVN